MKHLTYFLFFRLLC